MRVIAVTGLVLQFDAFPKINPRKATEEIIEEINEVLKQAMPDCQPQLISDPGNITTSEKHVS